MKLIKAKFEILEPKDYSLDSIYKQIEIAGRTCYSPETEVLTDNGWKRIDNILNTDKVLSYNPINNTIIYDYPNLIVKDYDDTMIEINHPNIKVCVTKDHRIYQSVPEKRDYNFIKASQLAGIEKIPKSKQCRFRIPKYFESVKRNVDIHIPSIVYSKEILNGNRHSSTVTVKIQCNKDFMVIAGAFISEGHTFHGEKYGAGSYCQITQTEDTPLYNNIISALNNLGWKYRIKSDPRKPKVKWIIFGTNQCWVTAFDDLFGHGSKNKHLPVWFRTLPDNYLKILIHNMYLGDGSHNTTRNEKYLSISKRLLDEVQEVFILLGTNGTSHFNKDISQMNYFEESHRDSWIISRKKHVNTFHYTGKVYCTSTKSGIICIKYRGTTCWCGNCYKSEYKITENSAVEFVDRLIKSKHGAMLEHGTVYLFCDNGILEIGDIDKCGNITKLSHNKYSKSKWLDNGLYITTNYRVLVENNWLDTLKYLCEPTEYHEKRVTVKFITSIGISREFNRHRVHSIAEQSTRYCNYSKDKFNNEITFIMPTWYNEDTTPDNIEYTSAEYMMFYNCYNNELIYKYLIEKGMKPQEARDVLPLSTATELIHTAFISDWKHFFDLRCAENAHPDARSLATSLKEEFLKRGYL